ncbi:MAG: BON domain-containing protein [Alphaproteobacteria bacterium]|nr:BON domain-containing protein [Alphaproteobacteria bacterium]
MKRLFATLVFVLLSAAQAGAATEPPRVRIVDADPEPITLEANKGQLLRLVRPVDTVFIAEPGIADVQLKSPTLIYIFGRRPGETTLFAVDKREMVILNTRVVVAHNLTRLKDMIRGILPDDMIDVRSVEGTVVMTGAVSSAEQAEDLRRLATRVLGEKDEVINRVRVTGPNQVNLRVRIAEISRELNKKLGINWDVVKTAGSLAVGIAVGNPAGAVGAALAQSPTSNNITAAFNGSTLDVNALIDALDDEGLITVLAEPNLTAMSGETASFLAGGEFPIPVSQDEDTITIEFKKFGVSLAFTPTLLGSGRINMRVRPEVSQLSDAGAVQVSGFSIPALTTRRAETTVELGTGQSFAIAGLLQNTTNQSVEEFPGLAQLPVIGPLFRSTQFQSSESELVIIVTPYVVRPVNTQLASPIDGFRPPHDSERILFGATHKASPAGPSGPPLGRDGMPGLVGPVGFILE